MRAPQLDALRGIAALLVVLHHWTALGTIGIGNIGVQLFFVLSGFLITGILLDQRERHLAGATDLREVLVSFLERRAARIWPVFFLTLFLIFLAGNRFERQDDMLWHVLFCSNLLFFQRGDFGSSLAHFWSLAVEQQFYAIWPFVVICVPLRYLEAVILALVAIAPLTRLGLHLAGFTHFASYNVLPFANFNSLGCGALVALWRRLPKAAVDDRWPILARSAAIMPLGVLGLAALAVVPANPEQTLFAVAFAWLVARAATGFGGVSGRALQWRPLVWLGVISYGVYVYHMFAPRIVGAGLRAIGAWPVMHSALPLLLLSAALTLATASLSWYAMEHPILRFRRRTPGAIDLRAGYTQHPEAR